MGEIPIGQYSYKRRRSISLWPCCYAAAGEKNNGHFPAFPCGTLTLIGWSYSVTTSLENCIEPEKTMTQSGLAFKPRGNPAGEDNDFFVVVFLPKSKQLQDRSTKKLTE